MSLPTVPEYDSSGPPLSSPLPPPLAVAPKAGFPEGQSQAVALGVGGVAVRLRTRGVRFFARWLLPERLRPMCFDVVVREGPTRKKLENVEGRDQAGEEGEASVLVRKQVEARASVAATALG